MDSTQARRECLDSKLSLMELEEVFTILPTQEVQQKLKRSLIIPKTQNQEQLLELLIQQPFLEILYWEEVLLNTTCGSKRTDSMDQSCKQNVVKIDTLVFRTFLNSILHQDVNSRLCQEMQFKL